MARGFAVTTRTGADHLAVVHLHHRRPNLRGVAGFTRIAGINMCRRLACHDTSIMARETTADNLRMINSDHRRPDSRGMTGLARVGGTDMSGRFTPRNAAIMTAKARSQNMRMINRCNVWQPGVAWRRQVTRFTHVGSTWMCGRFTRGNSAVMAAGAGANNLRMIHGIGRHRRPVGGKLLVAGITYIGCVDVIG